MAGIRNNRELGEESKFIPLELYIHIPFCIRKCLYCDFLSFYAEEEIRERYVTKLTEELRAMSCYFRESQRAGRGYQVISVFFGGGTPSVLTAEQIKRIMDAVRRGFNFSGQAEVTIEANPGTVDAEKLKVYRDCGINRLSLGLQSANDRELTGLGRIHTFREFLDSFRLAREAGFQNINVDLMSALPGQTLSSYRETLRAVTELSPEHISAYSLIIEEGTPFYEKYGKEKHGQEKYGEEKYGEENQAEEKYAGDEYGGNSAGKSGAQDVPPLPDEDAEREMYHFTKSFLKEKGYERYEISNYARSGMECRHNQGYWTGLEYLGLGLGASSYMKGERFTVETDLERYLSFTYDDFRRRSQHRERELLTKKEKMEEFMFLGLRLSRGVNAEEFMRRFGTPLECIYGGVLSGFLEDGLMEKYAGGIGGKELWWRLTEYGTDVSNRVLSGFLL